MTNRSYSITLFLDTVRPDSDISSVFFHRGPWGGKLSKPNIVLCVFFCSLFFALCCCFVASLALATCFFALFALHLALGPAAVLFSRRYLRLLTSRSLRLLTSFLTAYILGVRRGALVSSCPLSSSGYTSRVHFYVRSKTTEPVGRSKWPSFMSVDRQILLGRSKKPAWSPLMALGSSS